MSAAAMTAANAIPVKRWIDKAVALEMAKLVQDGGLPVFWGLLDTLAERIGTSRRTVQRALDRLLKAGALIRLGIHPVYRTVRYYLAFAVDRAAGPAPDWPTTQAKMARDPGQNGLHTYNRSKTEEGREASERARATPPRTWENGGEGEGKAADRQPVPPVAREPVPPAEPPPQQPPDADPPEPPPADADPERPERLLTGGRPDTGPGDDLDAWRPDQAGVTLARVKGAVDIEAETSVFLATHKRRGTAFAELGKRWLSWCERIVTYGPNGGGTRTEAAGPPTIDGDIPGGRETRQPADIVIPSTSITVPATEPTAGGEPWDRPASEAELDAVVDRIATHWELDLRKQPNRAAFLAELRRGLARYPTAVLHRAVDGACDDLRFPPKVADFTKRAAWIMQTIESHLRQQRDEAERVATEAARAGQQATVERREAEAAEATERAEAERIMNRHGIEPDLRERIKPLAEILARIWPVQRSPRWGTGLFQAQACEALAIAADDVAGARAFVERCERANQDLEPEPELSRAEPGAHPVAMFADIVRRAHGEGRPDHG